MRFDVLVMLQEKEWEKVCSLSSYLEDDVFIIYMGGMWEEVGIGDVRIKSFILNRESLGCLLYVRIEIEV